MATLLAVYNSDGCVGRCDAKCYEATHDVCICICGGANHGVGKARAQQNARLMAGGWLRDYAEREGHDVRRLQVELGIQGELF